MLQQIASQQLFQMYLNKFKGEKTMNISKERLEKALSRLVYNFTENEGHSEQAAMDICDFTEDEFNYIRSLFEYENGITEQFFRPIMCSNRRTTVFNRNYLMHRKEHRSPDALTEHAVIGDKFVNSICEKIYNSHVPSKLIWLGSRSHKLIETLSSDFNGISPHKIKHFYLKYWSKSTYTTSVMASDFSITDKYIVNHTKKLFIDGAKYYKNSLVKIHNQIHCLNPIPLLTCVGNGCGCGDYIAPTEDSDFHLVGSWAWDELSIYHEPPKDYRELDLTFKNKFYI